MLLWITYHCNFDCPYCVIKREVDKIPETRPPEDWTRAINRFKETILIDITGGEPLCYKVLDKLIKGINPQHLIAITTNFSIPKPPEFYRRFCSVTLSFHPTMLTREKEIDFFRRAEELREGYKGSLAVNFVAYRPQMHRIPGLKDKFESMGIRFHVDPQSPILYSAEEQTFLKPYLGEDRTTIGSEDEKRRFGKPRLCSAGQTYVQVLPNGTMLPCFAKPPLGSFFDDPIPLNNDLIYCDTKGCGGCDWDACWIYDLQRNLIKAGK